MTPLNTLPIEGFLNKARVALRSKQKHITIDANELQLLHDSLAVVMTRIAGNLDKVVNAPREEVSSISINMDGGKL